MSTSPALATFITPDALLAQWQGHRRLTRRVIEAFPDDKLFTFSVAGMRPFGGSTINDACRCGWPRSSQCGGGETGPPTSPPGVLAALSRSKSAMSASSCSTARCCRSSNSSSVSTLRVPNRSSRCIGTPTMSVPGHLPVRSGSPHAVRGTA